MARFTMHPRKPRALLAAALTAGLLCAGALPLAIRESSAQAQTPAAGSISVVLDAQPDASDDFAFTANGAGVSGFTLDDDADPTLSNSATFAGLEAGAYAITGPQPTGWTMANLTCTSVTPEGGVQPLGVTATANINLDVDENVQCTFTYQRTTAAVGTLRVVKDVVNDGAGTALASEFSLHVMSDGVDVPSSPAPGSSAGTLYALAPGAYTVSEDPAPGYVPSFSGDCLPDGSVSVVTDATATCVVTNADAAAGTGSITIVKDAQPNAATDFLFSAAGLGSDTFALDDDTDPALPNSITFPNLPAGTYEVTEGVVAGWTLTDISCTGAARPSATEAPPANTIAIDLAEGANIICTIVNVADRPTGTASLTIIKEAGNQAGSAAEFRSTGGPGDGSGFALDDDPATDLPDRLTFDDLPAGSYTVAEAVPAGWALDAITCRGGGTKGNLNGSMVFVDLVDDADVICTFIDRRLDGPVTGSISITKDTGDAAGGPFAFTTTGGLSGDAGFALDDDSDTATPDTQTFSGLAAGAFTVTETAFPGWDLTSITCDSDAATPDIESGEVSILLGAGANVSCTFTNATEGATGSITIVKQADPADGTDFSFTPSGFGSGSFVLDDDVDATLPDRQTFSDLPAGAYSVTELETPGWLLDQITCVGLPPTLAPSATALNTIDVTLAAWANVECTFVNIAQSSDTGSLTIVKDAGDATGSAVSFTTTGGIGGDAGFALDDDPATALADTQAFTALAAGAFTVTETPAAGWVLTGITCDSAAATVTLATGTVSVALAAGDDVTCTFVNAPENLNTGNVQTAQGIQSKGNSDEPNRPILGLADGGAIGLLASDGRANRLLNSGR